MDSAASLRLPLIPLDWSKFHLDEYIHYFSALVKTSRGVLRREADGAVLACMGNDMWNSILFQDLNLGEYPDYDALIKTWAKFFTSLDVDHYDAYFLSTIPNKYGC